MLEKRVAKSKLGEFDQPAKIEKIYNRPERPEIATQLQKEAHKLVPRGGASCVWYAPDLLSFARHSWNLLSFGICILLDLAAYAFAFILQPAIAPCFSINQSLCFDQSCIDLAG